MTKQKELVYQVSRKHQPPGDLHLFVAEVREVVNAGDPSEACLLTVRNCSWHNWGNGWHPKRDWFATPEEALQEWYVRLHEERKNLKEKLRQNLKQLQAVAKLKRTVKKAVPKVDCPPDLREDLPRLHAVPTDSLAQILGDDPPTSELDELLKPLRKETT